MEQVSVIRSPVIRNELAVVGSWAAMFVGHGVFWETEFVDCDVLSCLF